MPTKHGKYELKGSKSQTERLRKGKKLAILPQRIQAGIFERCGQSIVENISHIIHLSC